jgi:hypothetical protein
MNGPLDGSRTVPAGGKACAVCVPTPGVALALLFVALLPANIYAAQAGLTLTNAGDGPCTFVLTPNAYRSQAARRSPCP